MTTCYDPNKVIIKYHNNFTKLSITRQAIHLLLWDTFVQGCW